jgi:hypothetical protein
MKNLADYYEVRKSEFINHIDSAPSILKPHLQEALLETNVAMRTFIGLTEMSVKALPLIKKNFEKVHNTSIQNLEIANKNLSEMQSIIENPSIYQEQKIYSVSLLKEVNSSLELNSRVSMEMEAIYNTVFHKNTEILVYLLAEKILHPDWRDFSVNAVEKGMMELIGHIPIV